MMARRSDRGRSGGFTLIEVMVAMTIAALALGAVAATVSGMADKATAMQDRTYASWIAENKIAEMRLENVVPEVGESSGEVDFANLEWTWRATISETGVEDLFRLDVDVYFAGSDDVIRSVTGFIGEPGIPGQANLAWTRSSQAVGEDE